MGVAMGGAEGQREATNKKREGSIALATRPQSFNSVLKYLIDGSGIFPAWIDGLTVHVVSVDFLGACTFVAFRDDLTPPGFVLLLADILVKQTV